jgi:DNA polymerase III epsilon subunit-like protein
VLCEHYGIINTQAHRAMADVLATTEVLKQFLDLFRQYHTGSSIEDLLTIQKKPVGFGKSIFGA